jgi:hypothetical protein
MTIDFISAIDEIFSKLSTAWLDSAAIVGYVPTILWNSDDPASLLDTTKFYCRVQRFTVEQNQDTFATDVNARQFYTEGLISVSIYAPKSVANHDRLALRLAQMMRKSFSTATSSGVWFRGATIKERGDYDASFKHYSVVANYNHNEVF